MSTDLKAIMDRDTRRCRMLNDPDLTGETLLFALALDEALDSRKSKGRRYKGWIAEVAEIAWGPVEAGSNGHYRIRRVVGDDVPRYEPARVPVVQCVAPMIRREGLCGKAGGTLAMVDRDPDTGEARWIGLCSRHRGLVAKFDARRREWTANGKPSPPPNAGGVLKRYFVADWTEFYRWAAPWRTPLDGEREPTPPRPNLRLVRDDEIPGGVS